MLKGCRMRKDKERRRFQQALLGVEAEAEAEAESWRTTSYPGNLQENKDSLRSLRFPKVHPQTEDHRL